MDTLKNIIGNFYYFYGLENLHNFEFVAEITTKIVRNIVQMLMVNFTILVVISHVGSKLSKFFSLNNRNYYRNFSHCGRFENFDGKGSWKLKPSPSFGLSSHVITLFKNI